MLPHLKVATGRKKDYSRYSENITVRKLKQLKGCKTKF